MTLKFHQSEAAECGLACLAMVLSHHGHEVDLATLRRRFSVSLKGMTMKTIVQVGQKVGLASRGLRLELADLVDLKLPAILHWDMNHFVVLSSVRGNKVTIHDPARGTVRMTLDEVDQHFTGIALELTPTKGFERKKEHSDIGLSSLVGRVDGMTRALLQALALSVVLQLFLLASPFYMQLAVDEAVLTGDGGLLVALAVGFGLFTAIKLIAEWMRAQVLLILGSLISHQMVVNLFHHMVRLPLDWFEKRHIGDLVSRFGSTRPIKELITDGLLAAVVDGAMAILTLVVIFLYSPALAAVVLTALVLYAAIRIASFRFLRQREEEAITAGAKEQTSFIETTRAIQTIKIFGNEAEREAVWQNRFADTIAQGVRLGRLNTGFTTINSLIYGIETILVVFIGARLAMDGDLTIGMLFAFMSYKQQFLDKATRLLETAISYRMLDLHLDRIGDIALAEREKGLGASMDRGTEPLITQPICGGISLKGIAYRYAETEPDVIADIDLDVTPGEFVAITGPSGGGKTTLLKVMLGLFRPTAGEVRVDGTPLDHIGPNSFRAQVGVVMQEDQLLSGSLMENITFFDLSPDLEWMRQCAVMAGLDAEIMAMPMNYNTLVGDMGTGLSGGQRQRLLLARALYRRPRILFMDEGTSNLDVAKEREVNNHLKALGITRIVIAHRPQTIAAADRILMLKEGKLTEMPQSISAEPAAAE